MHYFVILNNQKHHANSCGDIFFQYILYKSEFGAMHGSRNSLQDKNCGISLSFSLFLSRAVHLTLFDYLAYVNNIKTI